MAVSLGDGKNRQNQSEIARLLFSEFQPSFCTSKITILKRFLGGGFLTHDTSERNLAISPVERYEHLKNHEMSHVTDLARFLKISPTLERVFFLSLPKIGVFPCWVISLQRNGGKWMWNLESPTRNKNAPKSWWWPESQSLELEKLIQISWTLRHAAYCWNCRKKHIFSTQKLESTLVLPLTPTVTKVKNIGIRHPRS